MSSGATQPTRELRLGPGPGPERRPRKAIQAAKARGRLPSRRPARVHQERVGGPSGRWPVASGRRGRPRGSDGCVNRAPAPYLNIAFSPPKLSASLGTGPLANGSKSTVHSMGGYLTSFPSWIHAAMLSGFVVPHQLFVMSRW